MTDKQRTLKGPITISGAGLHTGHECTVTFRPAEINHGIKFRRIDLENQQVIDAIADYVVDTNRGTTIQHQGVRISTIEHTLAAIVGASLDNVLIDINSDEMPIFDGSSRIIIEALEKAGFTEQSEERHYFEPTTTLTLTDPKRKSEMVLIPEDRYRVSTMIDFDSRVLGTQYASIEDIRDFATEVADCRTFVFLHELEYLISNDLIKGGDVSNAIVFVDKMISDSELERLAIYFNKEKIEVLKEGILNNIQLHHHNEPARHKLLDVIGDLALVGFTLKGHVIATRPGHSVNTSFAKFIREQIKETMHKPSFDIFKPPIYDINDIKKILPHRPPFLLVDKILELNDHHVLGLKNVTMNEPFFVGHFPNEPIMPGVLQIEAMAQTGGILALYNVPDPENYNTYFIKIENVRFRHKVVPGDTLIFDLELLSPVRRGIFHVRANAYVNNNLVTEAELMAQILRKPQKS